VAGEPILSPWLLSERLLPLSQALVMRVAGEPTPFSNEVEQEPEREGSTVGALSLLLHVRSAPGVRAPPLLAAGSDGQLVEDPVPSGRPR
jgi:hypothetical protein